LNRQPGTGDDGDDRQPDALVFVLGAGLLGPQRIGDELDAIVFGAAGADRSERRARQARLLSQQSHLVCTIAQARAEKASVIVARLDRLTRSTGGLALILNCGPKLLVVETPNARPFVLQIYAAATEEYPMRTPTRL
jgi:hypothetical protein